ncbi:hypothetical protein EVAR_20119_1 [Eumeta japonica]|uniref:Uncharacterized protein n=1 Tax=Eumeta variegata TaxID=151549 RepID=A0A4C1V2B9_EUMVA|nr:hypothetical protein EVAR_20119_1 [Eumeta japonica]
MITKAPSIDLVILQRVDYVTEKSVALMTIGPPTADSSHSGPPYSGACYGKARKWYSTDTDGTVSDRGQIFRSEPSQFD